MCGHNRPWSQSTCVGHNTKWFTKCQWYKEPIAQNKLPSVEAINHSKPWWSDTIAWVYKKTQTPVCVHISKQISMHKATARVSHNLQKWCMNCKWWQCINVAPQTIRSHTSIAGIATCCHNEPRAVNDANACSNINCSHQCTYTAKRSTTRGHTWSAKVQGIHKPTVQTTSIANAK